MHIVKTLLVPLSPCPFVPLSSSYGVRAMREPDPGGTAV
jgi:hypothetical protein